MMHARISNAAFWRRFALLAVGAGRADTEVVQEQIHASGVVLARSILAHANVILAMYATPSLRAHALETTDFVSTCRAVQARIGCAVVYVGLAGWSSVAFATVTNEGVVEIYAAIGTNWIARIALAFVDFRLALQPDEARSASADEALQLVYACSSVLTRIRRAVINRMLALLACVTRLARANIVVDLINTLTIISAWSGCTLVDVSLAGRTRPSRMADALVTEELVHANSVQARIT